MASAYERRLERKRCLEVMGLTESASNDDIKAKYKVLARQWHPDKNQEEGATQKMQEITAARDYLIEGHQVFSHHMDSHDAFFFIYMRMFPWYRNMSNFFGHSSFFDDDDDDDDDDDEYSYYYYDDSFRHQFRRSHSPQPNRSWASQHDFTRPRQTTPPRPPHARPAAQQPTVDRATRRKEKKYQQKQRKKEEKAAAQAEKAAAASQRSRSSTERSSSEKDTYKPAKPAPTQAAHKTEDKAEKASSNDTASQRQQQQQQPPPAPSAPPKKSKQQIREEERRRAEERERIGLELKEKMEREKEKKARKQAAKEEKERQEAEERRRQEELEIAEEARRIREQQLAAEAELAEKERKEAEERERKELLEAFDKDLYLDSSGDFVTKAKDEIEGIKIPPPTPPVEFDVAPSYHQDHMSAQHDYGDHHPPAGRGRGNFGMDQGQGRMPTYNNRPVNGGISNDRKGYQHNYNHPPPFLNGPYNEGGYRAAEYVPRGQGHFRGQRGLHSNGNGFDSGRGFHSNRGGFGRGGFHGNGFDDRSGFHQSRGGARTRGFNGPVDGFNGPVDGFNGPVDGFNSPLGGHRGGGNRSDSRGGFPTGVFHSSKGGNSRGGYGYHGSNAEPPLDQAVPIVRSPPQVVHPATPNVFPRASTTVGVAENSYPPATNSGGNSHPSATNSAPGNPRPLRGFGSMRPPLVRPTLNPASFSTPRMSPPPPCVQDQTPQSPRLAQPSPSPTSSPASPLMPAFANVTMPKRPYIPPFGVSKLAPKPAGGSASFEHGASHSSQGASYSRSASGASDPPSHDMDDVD